MDNLRGAYPWAIRVERFPDEEWGDMPPRAEWGDGPWLTEPDLIEWRSTGIPYPLLIMRGGMGALCGYVALPPTHPLHGRSNVRCTNWAGPSGSCRIATGEPPDHWWLGFDCGHAGEYVPLMEARGRWFSKQFGSPPLSPFAEPSEYVPIDECKKRVEVLAALFLAAATDPSGKSLEIFVNATSDS